MTPRDLEIFRVLDTYDILPAEFVSGLIGRSHETVRHRYTDLIRKPSCYIKINEWSRMRGVFRTRLLELDERGRNVLGKTHDPMTHDRQLNHRLMVSTAIASMDLGAKRYGADIVYPDDLKADVDFKPQNPDKPFSFKTHITHNGETKDLLYTPDDVRGYETPKGQVFIKLEAETGENPITRTNLSQSSVMRKFLADQFIFRNRLYEHWGIPSLFTVFVTPSQTHIDTMKKCLLGLTNGRGSKYTLFKTFPTLYTWDQVIKPTPELFTGPWQRAGFPDYTFTDEV